MKSPHDFTGKSLHPLKEKTVEGKFLELEGEKYYSIRNYDCMEDFFIAMVSPSDQWMYISSNGSLTAGRKNRDNALFPYYTVDKIHDYHGTTGSRTYLIVEKSGREYLWEPFLKQDVNLYNTERIIYKNLFGNKIRFQEINHDLALSFHYEWSISEEYGFVKSSGIYNLDPGKRKIRILDGIKNILPPGSGYAFQNEYSNLLDAYKKSELLKESGLGLFTLSSVPVDRPEPSEALNANTVFSLGTDFSAVLLSDKQLKKFLQGNKPETETDIRASRGYYSVYLEPELNSGQELKWMFVADVNLDAVRIWKLHDQILDRPGFSEKIRNDLKITTEKLKKIISAADGMQVTECEMCTSRHSFNSLYNAMRGGIFFQNYQIDKSDLQKYIGQINPFIAEQFRKKISILHEPLTRSFLINWAKDVENADLQRIVYEYLPLGFSRRHGDPSRPWNHFSLPGKEENGTGNYHYEGNWRDIFQNWEALAWSFPAYTDGMITRFLNASTADGYNPYRITREGIDWECPDPESPWAFIGYWGDHQIIYLLKLLEFQKKVNPGKLTELLESDFFVYANLPYRIRSYKEIVDDPHNTIVFDSGLSNRLRSEMSSRGADAILLRNVSNDELHRVNLVEKILVTFLTKISNFIPDAGIWLNTQRPEWNDANNALVGNGSSMVTVYYLKRFVSFWIKEFQKHTDSGFSISAEVIDLFEEINSILLSEESNLQQGFTPATRKGIADKLGKAHENYRNRIYNNSFSGTRQPFSGKKLLDFLFLAERFLESSIRNNKRKDGLYHSYNLVKFTNSEIRIRHLYEMLEGQVAALSSGILAPEEALQLLDSLKRSAIYREDQYSYMLYPNRELTRFMDKGRIDESELSGSGFLKFLMEKKDESVVRKSKKGVYFHPSFRNASMLKERLEEIRAEYPDKLTENEKTKILELYEKTFDHASFTGRSGTFFGYEGLGSIYWHMVSKLLLAVQECFFTATDERARAEITGRLTEHYYEIKAGIGLNKPPELYGAFPFDAYSHTPEGSGVKQPGLTGQVKEDVISRFGEMGIRIQEGRIQFDPALLNRQEFRKEKGLLWYYNIDGRPESLTVDKGSLAYTYCQVPVILSAGDKDEIRLWLKEGKTEKVGGRVLPLRISKMILNRTGQIEKLEISIAFR